MPQLDLTWFLFNFFLAWTLVYIILVLLLNQNWFTNNENLNNENNTYIKNNESKNWTW